MLFRSEVRAIVAAVRQGIPAVVWSQIRTTDVACAKELAEQLAGNQGTAPDLAQWAVETWRAVQR